VLCCVRWHVSLHRSHTQACRHGRGDAPVEAAARRAGAHVVGRLLLGRHGLLFLCVVEEGGGRENEAPGAGLCCGVMVAVYRRGQSAAAAGSRHRDQVKLPSLPTRGRRPTKPLGLSTRSLRTGRSTAAPKVNRAESAAVVVRGALPDPACACESCCGRAPASSQGRASCKESEAALPLPPPQQARSRPPVPAPPEAAAIGVQHCCGLKESMTRATLGKAQCVGKQEGQGRVVTHHTWQAAGWAFFDFFCETAACSCHTR